MVGAALPETWADENPYFLAISTSDGEHFIIDLGESGWMAKYEGLMRRPGMWALFKKLIPRWPVLRLIVIDGEQPYYVARHVGIAGSGGSNEVTLYGIGKKRLDGHVDRLWSLPDGSVCAGDDVDIFAAALLQQLGPRP